MGRLGNGQVFQSLIGRLKTSSAVSVAICLAAFQSLIGRLKTNLKNLYVIITDKFQSLIGRLKTNPHTASAAGFELKSQL